MSKKDNNKYLNNIKEKKLLLIKRDLHSMFFILLNIFTTLNKQDRITAIYNVVTFVTDELNVFIKAAENKGDNNGSSKTE